MDSLIRKQILAIRDSAEVNMFDVYAVQHLAHHKDYHELVLFLQGCREEYINFILYGDNRPK